LLEEILEMTKKKLFTLLSVFLILVVSINSAPLGATEQQEIDSIIGAGNPEYHSGAVWLALTGNNPVLGAGIKRPEELSTQAVGGAAVAMLPYRDPAAKFSRNILVSRDYGNIPIQTEPHLSVNPNDPDHLVVGMIDYNFPGVATYVSIDGGATWDGPSQPKIPRGQFTGAGDPVTAFDRDGNAYITQLALSVEKFVVSGIWGYFYTTNVVVNSSTDGGFNWGEGIIAIPGEIQTIDYDVPEGEKPRGEVWTYFLDKPWLTVGPSPDDPSKDILYVSYTLFIDIYSLAWLDELPALDIVEEYAVIEMVRSEDGGKTWSSPMQVSPYVSVNPTETTEERLVHGSQPMVAPDGTVYVAYIDSTDDGPWKGSGEILVARSNSKGESFNQRQVAARFVELDYLPRSSSFRLWGTGFPQTTVGPDGELYVAYVSYPSDNLTDSGDVFIVASDDRGASWTDPIRVNDDQTDHLQFFPSITTDPDGSLHMMWGDTRDDPSELAYHIYYSTSTDGGATWQVNSRVSDFPSNPNYAFPYGTFIGDYFSIDASSEDVYMVWADSRLGEVLGTNQKIAFARNDLMPTPSIFLSPPSGPAGRDVVIQGNNFQPESEIFVEVGGVLTATSFTNLEGNFTATIFAPIAGEGARDIVVSDISGNVAVASFYTEFGFDTFQNSVDEINTRIDDLSGFEPPVDTNGAPDDDTDAGQTNDWVVAILGAALFIALVALGALWYRQKIGAK
jgi:hypothetical protein